MTHFEQQFFRHTKPRDEGLTPRDRLQWYVDTEESAQVSGSFYLVTSLIYVFLLQILKKIANGTRVAGFRSKLLSHYQDLLRSHGNAAADITPDEIEALSRYVSDKPIEHWQLDNLLHLDQGNHTSI